MSNEKEKEKGRKKLITKGRIIKALIIVSSVLVNVLGGELALKLNLPIWFDSLGTFYVAYVFGPVVGAIVGFGTNLILALFKASSIYYCITGCFIGVAIGLYSKKNYFNTFFRSMSMVGMVTTGCVLIDTSINFIFFNGKVGNIWGQGVADLLMEKGIPKVLSVIIGQFYVDFLDKFIIMLIIFFFIRLKGRRLKRQAALSILVVGLVGFMLGAGTFYSHAEKVEDSVESVDSSSDSEATDDSEGEDVETIDNGIVDASYIQTIYNSENGLPCGHANDIVQAPNGILWIGTYAGLYRYNGSDFRYMSDYDMIKNVNCLYVNNDERDTLIVGTNDNGLVICNEEGTVEGIDSNRGLPADSIRCITRASDGEYYVGTTDCMVVVKKDKILNVEEKLLDINCAIAATANKHGHVVTVTNDGRLMLLKNREIKDSAYIGEKEPYSCCDFIGNTLYTGTMSGRIIKYKVENDRLEEIKSFKCKGFQQINQFCEDKEGRICVCADNGIGFFDDKSEFKKQKTVDFNYSIEKMTIDYQGNLWFASSRLGLLRLSQTPFSDVYSDVGINGKVINTTFKDGNLLYSGTDDGLEIIDIKKKELVKNNLTKMLEGIRIRCIKQDSNGIIWIANYGKGVVYYDKEKDKIKFFDSTNSDIGSRARICYELKDGAIAVGSDTGFSFIRDKKVVSHIPYGGDFGSTDILSILETSDGTIYLGTDGSGIVTIRDAEIDEIYTREDGLSSGVILRMVEDKTDGEPNGNVFIITSNGICYKEKDSLRNLEHFPYSNNYDMVINDNDEAMVLGSAGIYIENRDEILKDKEDPNYSMLTMRSGLMGALTANSWNYIDEKGNLYLSTDRGIYKINTNNYRYTRDQYKIALIGVQLDDDFQSVHSDKTFRVGRNVKKIEFRPEIVNYTLEDPVISCYLEGFDNTVKKVPLSEFTRVTYSNLSPGSYKFKISVLDTATGETVEQNTYKFIKEKAMYDNGWFIIYMLAVAILFVGWVSWYITKKATQRTIYLQQEKLKIAMQQVQMGNETILAIAKTVDAKDPRTSKHSQRVSEYSALIASKYGFTKKQVENIRRAALLHDIGKIGIPDSILNKPARLTDEEYAIMKTHPTRGAEILKDFTLIENVVEGAKYHHERYDGKGYPEGLKGEEIPLYGRIIAIADAFDAMTANRVYRKKQDFGYVMSELHNGRGTQFDPDLLDLFLQIIDEGDIDINALYADVAKKAEEEEKDKKEEKGKEGTDEKEKEEKKKENSK
ncbi:MAG: HD domain-containing protein [Lachnospiraceae bacterium]|nr:HD domain-containing protein [Lachnospiraceae bacterium]